MVQSDNPLTDDIDITTDIDELPKGEARLVLRDEDVTTVIQGDAETVEQRLWQEVADDLGMSVEEMKQKTADYPMPDFGEGLVPADEVHETDDTESDGA
jgi:hypothetical protein